MAGAELLQLHERGAPLRPVGWERTAQRECVVAQDVSEDLPGQVPEPSGVARCSQTSRHTAPRQNVGGVLALTISHTSRPTLRKRCGSWLEK